MKTISKSKVLCYVDCPRLYKFKYILKLPEQEHPAAGIGKTIHTMAENFYKKANANSNREECFEIIKSLLPDSPCEKTKFYAKNFHTLIMQEIEEHGEIKKPAYVEVTVEHEGIKGIVDKVIKFNDGTYGVADYKTGSPKNIKHYMYELSLYAWLIEKTKGIKVTKVAVDKLKNKGKIHEWYPVTQNDMRKAVALTRKVEALIKAGEFDMKKGQTCYWCPHKDLCYKMEQRKITDEN